MATTYAYLVDPNKQYMTKSGTINVNGTLRVYDAATDDIVITYKDFNGTENEASITLDNNGRAIVIADSARAYRLEVYDRYGSLQWTVSPLWCLAAGGGVNVHTTRVISTDGSIDVDQIDVGSTTTYDIGLAPSDSMEYLEWVKCNDEGISNGTWYPTYAEGTMETSAGEGLQVGESRFYHITSTIKVYPTGAGINYETLSVSLIFNDGEEHELIRRDFDIDNSVNDPTLCEFSYDFACPGDGFIYIKVDGVNNFTQVDSELQVHRIYSGINAVPGSCAAKPWVSEYFEEKSSMSAYIPYSGLEYNQSGNITGISGSAIYAALDSGTVSAIASSYAESAISSISGWSADFSSISSKLDASASSMFQPSGDYQTAGDYAYNSAVSSKVEQSAFNQCCDEVRSAIDKKLDKSASSEFQPSGEYVYESAYSSFSSVVTNNISSISSTVSALTGQYIEQSASSMFQPSGSYVSSTDMSAYVPFSGLEGEGGKVTGISGSAFKGHEYTGINPVTVDNTADTISVEHRTLCVDSTMTAYNSGASAVIGVNSAYVEGQVSGKQDTLTFSYDNDKISAINGSALAGQGGGGLVTAIGTSNSGITSLNNSGLVDTAALHSADYSSLYVQEPLYISASGDSSYIGISGDVGGIDSATCSAIASAYAESAASSKLDTTAFNSGDFYSTSNPSGFIDAASASSIASAYQVVSATATQLYAFSAYLTSVNSTPISAARAGNAANASLANSAWYDGTGRLISALPDSATVSSIAAAYAESAASSKQDTLTFGYDDTKISAINGSALAGGGGVVTGDYVENSALDSATAYSATGSLTPLATGVSSISGQPLVPTYLANPTYQYGGQSTFVYMPASSIWTTADVATGIFSPLQYATGACLAMDAGNFKAYYKGNEWFVANTLYGYARGEVHQNRGSRVIVEHTGGALAVLSARLNYANVTLQNTAYCTAKMSVSSTHAYVQVQRGNSDSKYNSAQLDTDYLKFYNGMTTGYVDPEDTASGTAYMPSQTEYMYISSIPYWNGKADSSALSSYASAFSAGEGLEFVQSGDDRVLQVEAPVDIVAGPGIVIDNPDGNTLRVSMAADYEVDLYSGTKTSNGLASFTLSEYASNFDRIRFYGIGYGNTKVMYECPAPDTSSEALSVCYTYYCRDTDNNPWQMRMGVYTSTNGLDYSIRQAKFLYGGTTALAFGGGNTTQNPPIYRIVGIKRIAGGN